MTTASTARPISGNSTRPGTGSSRGVSARVRAAPTRTWSPLTSSTTPPSRNARRGRASARMRRSPRWAHARIGARLPKRAAARRNTSAATGGGNSASAERQPSQARDDIPARLVREARQQRVAHAIPEKSWIVVGWIFEPRQAGRRQRRHRIAMAAREQRTNETPAQRRDAGEAAHTGAFEHAHDQRFGLIIGGVAERDPRGAEPV